MIIRAFRITPKPLELVKVLREEFSNQYSYKIFGLGSNKSIIVQKSALVGVQVTQSGNEIRVDGTFPSVAASFLSAIISVAGIWLIPESSPWRNLEHEVASFLNGKYHNSEEVQTA